MKFGTCDSFVYLRYHERATFASTTSEERVGGKLSMSGTGHTVLSRALTPGRVHGPSADVVPLTDLPGVSFVFSCPHIKYRGTGIKGPEGGVSLYGK